MNQLWQMWNHPTTIDHDFIDKIITECEKYNPEEAAIGATGEGGHDNAHRRSEVRWVNKNDQDSAFIANFIMNFMMEANRNAFGFDVNYLNDIQYTIYTSENEGKYDWHYDTFWVGNKAYDRKLSFVMQLSDPSEYEGGDFEIDHQYPQPQNFRNKGAILVFPSFLTHRVTPLTKGTRKSLVAWAEGPKFK